MIEPEIAFADLARQRDLAEAFLKYIFRPCSTSAPDDMAFFAERIEKGVIATLESIVDSEFERMDYTDAIERAREVRRQKFEFPVKWGIDLQIRARALPDREARRPAGGA